MIWGDPHVVTFDLMRTVRSSFWAEKSRNWDGRGHWRVGQYVVPDIFQSGDYWVVRSADVKIQARYGRAGGYALHGLAFGGPFLQNQKLSIDNLWAGKEVIHWDGQRISVAGKYKNGLVSLSIKRWAQGWFKSASLELPAGVKVTIERTTWSGGASVTAYITMRRQPDQNGHCGPGDGNLKDDTKDHILKKWGKQVPSGKLLFNGPASSLLGTEAEAVPVAGDEYDPAVVCANSPPLPEDVQACEAALNGSAAVIREALLPGCIIDVCANGPGAVEAVSAAANLTTQEFLVAGAPPAPAADGWYDGGGRSNCDEGCEAVGLVCTEEQLRAHNADVDSPEKVRALIDRVGGKTLAKACDLTWGSADDVPNWWYGGCHASSASRGPSTFSCSAKPRGTILPKHRLCYCHAPVAPLAS